MGKLLCLIASLAPVSLAQMQIKLPEGTKVRVRLEQTLSSATAEEGQPVQMSVTEDVTIDGAVAIAQGSSVVGTVVQAVPKRRLGRTGKLDFAVERVIGADGGSVPLRYSLTKKEGGSNSVRTGIIAGGAAIIFWPAAPFFLLMKGKDVTMNKGMTFDVFTDQTHIVTAKTVTAQDLGARPPAPEADKPVAVKINSDRQGADIELDGAFVGSTPTTVNLTTGAHKIVVKSGAASWERTIQIQPGSDVSVTATLTGNDTLRTSASKP